MPMDKAVAVNNRFQSTHPRGVRRSAVSIRFYALRSFNPRTRVGCDEGDKSAVDFFCGFNPRTRVGCDGL